MLMRRISFYWAQGAENAPDIVRRSWDLWAKMNPGWEVEYNDQRKAKELCTQLEIHTPMTFQGLGDIFRVHDIVTHGGLYIDAAVVPLRPLDEWLPELCSQGFFAFHDPYRKRPIENWFLYAAPQNPIAAAWLHEIIRYWSIPRRPQRLKAELNKGIKGTLSYLFASLKPFNTHKKAVIEPKNRPWSVAPDKGAKRHVHPYFWPHYLFDHLLATQPEIRHAWGHVPKEPSYKNLTLRHSKPSYEQMTKTELDMLIRGAHMQKLHLGAYPPDEIMEHLFQRAQGG